MHVSRAGNLFSTLEEGIYKKVGRGMKGCKHIYCHFPPPPAAMVHFLIEKKAKIPPKLL